MLQEIIAGKICRENNLFMVGDVKQSISTSSGWLSRRSSAANMNYIRRKKKPRVKRLTLTVTSEAKNVTRTVNTVFEKVMEDYDEDARLHCTAPEEYPDIPRVLRS